MSSQFGHNTSIYIYKTLRNEFPAINKFNEETHMLQEINI